MLAVHIVLSVCNTVALVIGLWCAVKVFEFTSVAPVRTSLQNKNSNNEPSSIMSRTNNNKINMHKRKQSKAIPRWYQLCFSDVASFNRFNNRVFASLICITLISSTVSGFIMMKNDKLVGLSRMLIAFPITAAYIAMFLVYYLRLELTFAQTVHRIPSWVSHFIYGYCVFKIIVSVANYIFQIAGLSWLFLIGNVLFLSSTVLFTIGNLIMIYLFFSITRKVALSVDLSRNKPAKMRVYSVDDANINDDERVHMDNNNNNHTPSIDDDPISKQPSIVEDTLTHAAVRVTICASLSLATSLLNSGTILPSFFTGQWLRFKFWSILNFFVIPVDFAVNAFCLLCVLRKGVPYYEFVFGRLHIAIMARLTQH